MRADESGARGAQDARGLGELTHQSKRTTGGAERMAREALVDELDEAWQTIGDSLIAARWEARIALVTSIMALIVAGVAVLHG